MDRGPVKTEWTNSPSPEDKLQQYTTGVYARRNAILAGWVAESGPRNIVEVAAGCYDLAQRIIEAARPRAYVWSDGDAECVRLCRLHLKGQAMVRCWKDADLTADKLRFYDTFVCVSTEHLPGDVELVSRLRPGTRAFLCGASFPSRYHVRHWRSAGEMAKRYPMLDMKRVASIPLPRQCCKFLLWGERK